MKGWNYMGINSFITHSFLASEREKPILSQTNFLLGGRQTVFLEKNQIELIASKYRENIFNLDKKFSEHQLSIDKDTLRTKNGIPDSTFFSVLFGNNPHSIDATNYEKANLIFDLNIFPQQEKILGREFKRKYTRDYDYVYDGGCLDNVWNPSNALMNLVSMIKPDGRIINWAAGSNWPGNMCAISPEWLLGFYTINNFNNIRVYSFCIVNDGTVYPNSTVNVFRYNPYFSRNKDWDPFKAAMAKSSHPVFTVGFADMPSNIPKKFEIPMNTHYIYGDYEDWRQKYVHCEDVPFEFDEGKFDSQTDLPFLSDHFKFIGTLKGFHTS